MNFVKTVLKISAFMLVIILLAGCYAEPTDNDLERVKQQFLVMRFHAPFNEEWSGLSDKELFELSCKNNRVKCDLALDTLKNKDTDFYTKLMKNN